MSETLLQRYDRQVPRYTSYPTAPHFHGDIDASTCAGWLAGDHQTLSLYLHVPFCAEMCWFCGCHTKVTRRYDPVARYVEHMLGEISLVARTVGGHPKVTSLHWGGGSPTKLTPKDFSRIIAALRDQFDFAGDAEIAVEIDPRTLTDEFIEALAASGVRRASLGVQDFNDKVQKAINRVQPFELIEQSVAGLHAAGIKAINFDLIYGLPYQRIDDIRRNVDLAARLRPDRLSVFGYAHVPWMKTHQRMIEESALPDTSERYHQSEVLATHLAAHGYARVGLDHFALPGDGLVEALKTGRLRRNFQGYTTDNADALIGIGASSIGQLPQGYVQNHVALKAYGDAIEGGILATTRGVALTDDDRIRRRIIEKLMCELVVDLDEFGSVGVFQDELATLRPLEDDGLVDIVGGEITITNLGRPFMRLVCAAFDVYLKPAPARYSKAI